MLKLNRGILTIPFVLFISASINILTLSTAWAVSDEVAVQLLERLSELEQEVNNLRGENETLRRELLTIRSAQRTGFLEVDKRVSKLEKGRLVNQPTTTANNNTGNDPEKTSSPGVEASDLTSNQSSAAVGSVNITNTVPALEDPATVAATTLPTPGTIVARPSPITITPTAPAIEVTVGENNSQTSPTLSGEDLANQRRAVAPVNAEKTAEADKVDPNSPESYYYYGTQDKNETPAIASGAGVENASSKASLSENTQQAIPTAHKAKAAYNQAYKLLVNDPASAVPAFRAFMNNHPQHELVANAQYWLGEALYAQKDYSGATEEFMQVLKNHKGSPKAPGAALKLGYSFYELRQWDFARRTLEDTVRFFPETNAAKLAVNRLERMAAEGK